MHLALPMGGLNTEDVILSKHMNYMKLLTWQVGKDGGQEDTRSREVWPFCSIRGDISICKKWVCVYMYIYIHMYLFFFFRKGVFLLLTNQSEVQMKGKQLGYTELCQRLILPTDLLAS